MPAYVFQIFFRRKIPAPDVILVDPEKPLRHVNKSTGNLSQALGSAGYSGKP
jgi:hypothetical protein